MSIEIDFVCEKCGTYLEVDKTKLDNYSNTLALDLTCPNCYKELDSLETERDELLVDKKILEARIEELEKEQANMIQANPELKESKEG